METPQIEDIGSVSIRLLDEDSGELVTESPLYRCANRLLASVLFPQDTVTFRAVGNDVNGRPFNASLSKTATFVRSKFEVVMEGDDPIEVDQGQTISINLTVNNHDTNDAHYTFTAKPVSGFQVVFRPTSLTVPARGSESVRMIVLQLETEAGSLHTFIANVTDGYVIHSASNCVNSSIGEKQSTVCMRIVCIINNSAINSTQATPPPNECGCLNGGTCIVRIRRGRRIRRCLCPEDYSGAQCEIENPTW